MTIKFGPAGLGPVKDAVQRLEEYHKLGLRACEIAFTYSIYIKPGEAPAIREKAKELGIKLSIHAPYFVNLNSDEREKIEASKKRILDCCEIGELLGAEIVVFHAGFYGKEPREKAYEVIKKGVMEVMDAIKKKKWKIKIAPEVMGKINVFGSPQEIRKLVDDTGCAFCIDFAHLLARNKGIVDYGQIIEMFPEKNWHVHFSGIVYGDKGEKHHRNTEKEEWKVLLEKLPRDKEITIINEAPTPVEDSVEGLKIYEKMS